MKKILSLLLALLVVFGVFAMPTGFAAENYCKKIDMAVDSLRWYVNNNTVLEGGTFPAFSIIQYVFIFTCKDEYGTHFEPEINNYLVYEIPSNVFEAEARKHFKNVDVTALRSYTTTYYDPAQNEYIPNTPVYNADKDKYVINNMGGMGDSTQYVIAGYTDDNGKLTAYLNFGEPYWKEEFPDIINGKVEGKDYIDLGDHYLMIERALKTTVRIVNGTVQFASWEPLTAVPAVSGLITPDTVLSTTTSTPAQTSSKPTASKPASSNTSSAAATSSDATASDATVSDVSSDVSFVEPEDLKEIASFDSVVIEAVADAFSEQTVVEVMTYGQAELPAAKAEALKQFGEKFVAYEITAMEENVAVQPNGSVVATFAIPEGFDPARVAVIYVDDNGNTEEIKIQVADGKIKAYLTHFSTYAVVEKTQATEEIPTIGATDKPVNVGLMIGIIVGALVLLGGAFCAWFFLVFKKKKATAEKE